MAQARTAPAAKATWAASIAGALLGAAAWGVLSGVLSATAEVIRFTLALGVFTFGPGALVTWSLTRDLSRPARAWLACGCGVALSAALADVLSRLGAAVAFPYVAAAMTGTAVAWLIVAEPGSPAETKTLGWRGSLVALVALATGATAFAHRLDISPAEITVYGDYDSVDLSYYAAITSELTHHVPPLAPFYSGHALNYSWYPQLLLAMIHRFADVAILPIYFKLAWPAFLTLAAVCGYLFVLELAGSGAACIAMLLILLGGDFSWIVAWFFTPDTYLWDWLLWPTNFLAPTMEVLHFSTWTPSLPGMFVGLFALTRCLKDDDRRWSAIAALSFALLVEFKPFAFAILVGGTIAAAAAGRVGPAVRRQLVRTAALSVGLATPFLYQIASLYAESRSHLKIDFFLLPRTMLEKQNLTASVDRWAAAIAGGGSAHTAVVWTLAAIFFVAGGFGMRWLAVPRIVRAAFGAAAPPVERVLAWMILAGVALPFVLVTEPYHDTLQFYQTALYLMWIATAMTLVALRGPLRTTAIVAAFAFSLPPSVHFLADKWRDNPVHQLAGATRGERLIAGYLRDLDREGTIVMHDRPVDPSLPVILSERRSVLAWARYVTGSEERRADVEQFFESADGDPRQAIETLAKYGVTHILVRRDRDRVHPDVLARLRQVVGTPEAILYEAPPAGGSPP